MSKDVAQLIADARALASEQNFDACAQSFAEVFKAEPGNVEGLRGLAAVMLELDQAESALALLSDSINPENPDVPTLLKIANLLRGLHRLDEAADVMLGALAHDAQNEELLHETVDLFKLLGRESEILGEPSERGSEGAEAH